MRSVVRRFSWPPVAATAISAAVFAAVLGSPSVAGLAGLAGFGSRARWVALALVAALAVGRALTRRPRPRVPVVPLALALAFVSLALVSTAWSPDPRLTAERALSFALVLAAAAGLALAVDGRPADAAALLTGVVAGAAAACLAGGILLAVSWGDAVQAATAQSPARYRGIGANPNTLSLLAAVAAPAALALALRARTAAPRLLAGAATLGLVATIVASGSRGALGAALAGGLVVALLGPGAQRRRLGAAAGVVAVLGVGLALAQLPDALPAPPASATAPAAGAGPIDAQEVLPLEDEVGHPPLGSTAIPHRTLTGSSGRRAAWRQAVGEIRLRPATGYGFGVEDTVFLERVYGFESMRTESSYLGTALQLGLAGAALLAGLVLSLLALAARALPRRDVDRALLAAAAGGFLAGLVAGAFQSYLYAAGGVATLPVWICGLLVVGLAGARAAGAPARAAPVLAAGAAGA